MRKILTGSLLVAGLVAGSLLMAVLDPIGAVSAALSGKDPTSVHQTPLTGALDDLVGRGTLTQDQADAVQNEVNLKREEARANRAALGKEVFVSVAGQLGMSPKDLMGELRSGKSIAQVAGERGVDPNSIIQSVVATISGGIDQRVQDGKMSQERADRIKPHLVQRVTAFVNKVHPNLGRGTKVPADSGQVPPGTDQAPPTTVAPTTSAPTTVAPTTVAPTNADPTTSAPNPTSSVPADSTAPPAGTPGAGGPGA